MKTKPSLLDNLAVVQAALFNLANAAGDVPEWNKGGFAYEASRALKAAIKQAKNPKPVSVIVAVSGGLVQGARADGPAALDVFDVEELCDGSHSNPELMESWPGLKLSDTDGTNRQNDLEEYWEDTISKQYPNAIY